MLDDKSKSDILYIVPEKVFDSLTHKNILSMFSKLGNGGNLLT